MTLVVCYTKEWKVICGFQWYWYQNFCCILKLLIPLLAECRDFLIHCVVLPRSCLYGHAAMQFVRDLLPNPVEFSSRSSQRNVMFFPLYLKSPCKRITRLSPATPFASLHEVSVWPGKPHTCIPHSSSLIARMQPTQQCLPLSLIFHSWPFSSRLLIEKSFAEIQLFPRNP
jgi:hypothetical protein